MAEFFSVIELLSPFMAEIIKGYFADNHNFFFKKNELTRMGKSENTLPLQRKSDHFPMKRLVLPVLMCLLVAANTVSADTGRRLFTDGWTLNGTPVTLPRAMNEDEAFRVSIEQLTDTTALYEKHFEWDGNTRHKLFIEFEGVRQAAEVSLNGHLLGRHEDGITAFGFDLTPYLNIGDNILSVCTDNDWQYHEVATGSTFQWNDRNFNANYGGIIKRVWLIETDLLHQTLPLYSSFGTTGPYIYADQYDIPNHSANIHYETEVVNEDSVARTFYLRAEVFDADGELFTTLVEGMPHTLDPGERATVYMSSREEGIHFWSWGYGYLYTVNLKLVESENPWAPGDIECTDKTTIRTGFRKTEFHDGMFFLNDRALMVHGYAQRTSNEWPALGIDVPEWLSDYSNALMVEGGGNLVRWMHITPSVQDIESCDRVGLLQAMPAGDSEKDVDGRRWDQRVEVMRDAIVRNRNNPSIIFYESGNKGISDAHMRQMKALRDTYDPCGGRAIGCREMLASTTAEYGGEMLYINKSATKPVWAMEYCRDEALRRYSDADSYPWHPEGYGPLHKNADASAYNHNQDAFVVELVRRWYDYWRERPGTGTRVSAGGVKIIFSDSNTHHRGTENYRRSGVTDALRIPKDAYYAHQTMWDGWVDTEQHHTYIVGHWQRPEVNPQTGVTPATLTKQVVSTGEQVELFLNGRSLGYGRRDYGFLFTFDSIAWEKGTLEAVSRDAEGNELSRHSIETAGKPHRLRLTPITNPLGFRADGLDVALVQIEAVDKKGRRCPLDHSMLECTLDGEAEWRGGMASSTDPMTWQSSRPDNPNYILDTSLPLECGVNRVIIRSTTTPGASRLTVKAHGLGKAHLKLKTYGPDELSNQPLPCRLERGETPETPSFSVKCQSVPVASILATSNARDVWKSCDDNEETQWASAPGDSAAITYRLSREAEVSEVVMKLEGFRTKSYPLEISSHGQVLWSGDTEKTLGYVHIVLPPTRTDEITIALRGTVGDKDAFGLVELSDEQRQPSTEAPTSAKGQSLRIVEVEIVEFVP